MFSAVATRELPRMIEPYVAPRDYLRYEYAALVGGRSAATAHRYVLPATLRMRWAGEPGIRHWMSRSCARDDAPTIVYDPEHWELTPAPERRRFPAAARRAATLARSDGCDRFGLAPDGVLMFGLHPERCSYDLSAGRYRDVSWGPIDIVDIQAQLLISDNCAGRLGIDDYRSVVSSLATFVRRRNPNISVVAQVSFRHTPPDRMYRAIASVADVVDGIYFSYPSAGFQARCRYCSSENLRALLRFLRE